MAKLPLRLALEAGNLNTALTISRIPSGSTQFSQRNHLFMTFASYNNIVELRERVTAQQFGISTGGERTPSPGGKYDRSKQSYKKYGDHIAVDHLSFRVEKGQIYGFLGPNGAGKSTTMNIITGYLAATEGTVTIDGKDVQKTRRRQSVLSVICRSFRRCMLT